MIKIDSDIINDELSMAMKRQNGLTVISTNTGSGKSYNIERNMARFLTDALEEEQTKELVVEDEEVSLDEPPEKKMVVIIPDKINFPTFEKLTPHLMKYMPNVTKEEAYQILRQNILMVQNNLDCMCDGLSNYEKEIVKTLNDMDMPAFLKQTINEHIAVIQKYMRIKGVSKDDATDMLYQDMKAECERKAKESVSEIQKLVRSYLHNCRKELKEDENNEEDKKHEKMECEISRTIHFITLLYETAKINSYKIYVMTVEKFVYNINPVVEPSFFMTSPEFLENKIIVIDESDSVYTRMRNVMVEKVTESTYDFLDIMSELTQRTFRSKLNKNIQKAMNEAFPRKSSVARIENLLEDGNKYLNDFHIDYSYKTDENFEKQGFMPAILNDGSQYNLGAGKNFIQATFDEKKEQVTLTPLLRGTNKEDGQDAKASNVLDVVQFFHDGDLLIKRFKRFLDETSKSYLTEKQREAKERKNKKEKAGSEDYIDENNALWIVMNHLKMSEGYRKIFADVIKRPYHDVGLHLEEDDFISTNSSYYETGYDIKMIKDNPLTNAENSKIYCYLAKDTPEKVLLTMASYANVILLSATAKNRSINENFSLRYLKDSLKGDYHEISEQGAKDLKAFYDYRNQKYANGEWKIDVMPLAKNSSGKPPVIAEKLFQHPSIFKKVSGLINDVQQFLPNEDASYICNRYFNLTIVLYDFIKNPMLKSLVCLEKPELKMEEMNQKNAGYNGNLVKKIVGYIGKDLGIDTSHIEISSAVSRNFKEKIEEMQEHWAKGEKGIFFSTFATTAKGSNLQYPLPDDPEIRKNLVVLAPELKSVVEDKYIQKDIDCLYMGNYTYVTYSISPKSENRDKSFHEVLFETEKAYAEYQIPLSLKKGRIQRAYGLLEHFNDGQRGSVSIAYTDGIKNSYNKYIKQCVGRMDRVNVKNSLQKIYIESNNLDNLDRKELEETMDELIPGVMAIKKAIDAQNGALADSEMKKSRCQEVLYKASMQHTNSVNNFRLLLNTIRMAPPKRQAMAIKQYETLRRLVLCHPVLTEETFDTLSVLEKGLVRQYYIDTERNDVETYHYTAEKRDYMSDKDDLDIEVHGFNGEYCKIDAVQGRKTLLDIALKVKGAAQLFDTKGYAKEWKPGRYILTPKGVDIYNGILGEVIAKLIMERILAKLPRFNSKISEYDINESFLPQVYEKFDFRFGRLYIDVKNWQYGLHNRLDVNERKYRQHIEEKRDECDAVYGQKGIAVVVNVFPRDEKITNTNLIKSDNYVEIRRLINEDGSEDDVAKRELADLFLKGVEDESTDE